MIREAFAWILLILVLAALVLYVTRRREGPEAGRATVRRADAIALMDRLSQACHEYRNDHGEFPPGDGSGSADLVRALQSRSSKRIPYFEVTLSGLDARGNLQSPLAPGEIIYYRKVDSRFEVWCRDLDGRPLSYLTAP